MPRRQRKAKRRDELTLSRMLALTVGPDPRNGESDDLLEAVYELHRDRLLADCSPGTRPWAFWRFEPGVPADLRAERPALRPADNGEPDQGHDRELDRRRRDWLAAQDFNEHGPMTGHDPHLGGAR